jgi:threonine dehydratase
VDATVSIDRIAEAAAVIDPVFRDTPQFCCEAISDRLGLETVLKVECVNPIRSFKGRGSDYLVHRLGPEGGGLVCASAGNFGQGMAYACRKAGRRLTVFASTSANQLKLERMRALGAVVVTEGEDFDAAKDAARRHASGTRDLYVEDGSMAPIAEGAGTIGVELTRMAEPLDDVFIPLGNGALANGLGTWMRRFAPRARLIAVCAAGAPAMRLSWQQKRPVEAPVATIADGMAVRVPIPEALEVLDGAVDEVMLVTDAEMIAAMKLLFVHAGLVVEPAGAAGMAAIMQRAVELKGRRVATPLCGGNLTDRQIRDWLY